MRGPGGMALASLQSEGVTGGTVRAADDVVLGGRAFGSARPGWHGAPESSALGQAYGIAVMREQRAVGGHTWCIIRTRALREGRILEAATALATLKPARLIIIVAGPQEDKDQSAALLRACGLAATTADNGDAWSVVSAFDHASKQSRNGTAAVVATRGNV